MGFGDVEKNQYSKSHDTIEMYNKEIRYDYQAEVFLQLQEKLFVYQMFLMQYFHKKLWGTELQ
ncbi:hypothetical protein SFB3_157G1 [Candidatus Arthromitus sp. SFB-3]|nr:hypothetical protein SFB3_157G1 [Candidatus Arthromitus sp. SFB-3]